MKKFTQSIKYVILGIVLLLIAFFAGYYSKPAEVKIQKEYVDKIVEKVVYKDITNTTQNSNTEQQYHIIETTFPDGKYTKETYILNKSTVVLTQTKFIETDVQQEQTTSSVYLKTINTKYKWQTSLNLLYNFKDVDILADNNMFTLKKLNYQFGLYRHMIGNVYIGGIVSTKKDIGLSVLIGW